MSIYAYASSNLAILISIDSLMLSQRPKQINLLYNPIKAKLFWTQQIRNITRRLVPLRITLETEWR